MFKYGILLVYLTISNCDPNTAASKRMIPQTTYASFASKGYSKTYTTIPIHGTNAVVRQLPKKKCGNGGNPNGQNCPSGTDDRIGNVTPPGSNKNVIKTLQNKISNFLLHPKFLCLTYNDPNPVEIKIYDPKLQICCNGIFNRTSQSEECCDKDVIDSDETLCCGTLKITKPTDTGCCASTLYLKNDTLCCNGTLVPKTKYSACCGDRVFSEITEVCCGGRTFPKAHGDDEVKCCGDTLCNGTDRPVFGQTAKPGHVQVVPGPSSNVAQNLKPYILVVISAGSVAVIAVGALSALKYRQHNGLTTDIKRLVCSKCKTHSKETDADRESLIENNHSYDRPSTSIQKDPSSDSRSIGSSQYKVDLPVDNSNAPNYEQIKDVIDKTPYSCPGNILADHFKDIACQTISSEKACNRRTVFGQPFEHSRIVDMKNPTFQMPNSDVSVRLPDKNLIQHPIEMHGTSFGDILSIHKKINISTSEENASPVVEYMLTGVTSLDDYAVVTVPFIGQKDIIKVWKFHSDDGMRTKVEPIEVPLRTREKKDQPLCYEIEGDTVRIYTRSFSGFFITKGRHTMSDYLNLRAFLFGSHKRFFTSGRNEVRLRLYIADEIMKFKDYQKRMFETEELGDRKLIHDQPINLTEQVHEEDTLEASITDTTGEQWTHRIHPRTGQLIYPEIKVIKFEDIVAQCNECENCHFKRKTIPYVTEWYLEISSPISDTFSCVLDINCKSGQKQELNVITVDELLLRVKDRRPHEESNEQGRLEALKRFLVRMEEQDQAKFIEVMKERNNCKGTQILDIFEDLQRKMKPHGVYETTVATLKHGYLNQQLHCLEKRNILESSYFPQPVQRTGEDAPPRAGTPRAFVRADTQQPANDQVARDPSRSQASFGQPIGQALLKPSDGQTFLEPSDGQALLEPSVGQASKGQSVIQATRGHTVGNALNGQTVNATYFGEHNNNCNLTFENPSGNSAGASGHSKEGKATRGHTVGNALNGQTVKATYFGEHNNNCNLTFENPRGNSAGASGHSKDEMKNPDGFHRGNGPCRNELGSDLPVCSYPRTEGVQGANMIGSIYALQPDQREHVELMELNKPVQEHASLEETCLKQTRDSDTD